MSPYRSMMFTWLLVASVVLAATMLGSAIWFGPRIIAGADTTKAVKLNGDLQGCRSSLNAELVAAPNIDVDSAGLQVALLTSAIVQAQFQRDEATVMELLPKMQPARAAVDAAISERDAKVAHYRDLITLSRTDPERFLDLCHQEAP